MEAYLILIQIWANVASPIETDILKDFVFEICVLT